jgi:hypothetical protein
MGRSVADIINDHVYQIGTFMEVFMMGVLLLLIGTPITAFLVFSVTPEWTYAYGAMILKTILIGCFPMCYLLTALLLAPGIIADVHAERRKHSSV